MKMLLIIAVLAALMLAEQPAKLPDSSDADKLSPAHAAKLKEVSDDVRAKSDASDKAELVYLRAKDVRDKAIADADAVIQKMQEEANCRGCQFVRGPDGDFRWARPKPAPAEKPK